MRLTMSAHGDETELLLYSDAGFASADTRSRNDLIIMWGDSVITWRSFRAAISQHFVVQHCRQARAAALAATRLPGPPEPEPPSLPTTAALRQAERQRRPGDVSLDQKTGPNLQSRLYDDIAEDEGECPLPASTSGALGNDSAKGFAEQGVVRGVEASCKSQAGARAALAGLSGGRGREDHRERQLAKRLLRENATTRIRYLVFNRQARSDRSASPAPRKSMARVPSDFGGDARRGVRRITQIFLLICGGFAATEQRRLLRSLRARRGHPQARAPAGSVLRGATRVFGDSSPGSPAGAYPDCSREHPELAEPRTDSCGPSLETRHARQ